MVNITGEEPSHSDALASNAPEEKIHVSVRLRPLSEKELASNDLPEWECINNTTIIFKNSLAERSMLPIAYSFDRVFGCDSSTRQVYEEAAQRVALSVVSGINSSIFAYGQTSSGKTYTMCGITEYAVADIYAYIDKHASREFVLKFSALEIYNEAVRDLLNSDGTPLRLLDDPERGTVVERLTEVTLRDWSHLKELLSVCEAQRKIGETTLNEMSSRSHQILRLMVESSAREYKGSDNSSTLAASVHFIDLAGSERASQTLSVGTRLKEGSHINRSLLTLGTVIRKLSKGRNAHIPYRDSKLTRILQNTLGGNARTAIICTMSPAHSHVEQSRNTLLFASCAKQVSTNAHVNVVMSEKALVKQLQKELARLESQLKSLGSLSVSGDASALKEKEILIQKMDSEIRELTHQRDEAQSRLQNILQPSPRDYQHPKPWDELSIASESHYPGSEAFSIASESHYPGSEASEIIDPLRLDVAPSVSHSSDRGEGLNFDRHADQFSDPLEEQFLSDVTSPRMFIDKYFGPDPTQGWEKLAQRTNHNSEDDCKEVQCIEVDSSTRNKKSHSMSSLEKGEHQGLGVVDINDDHETIEPKTEDVQETAHHHDVDSHPMEQSPCMSDTDTSDSRSIDVSRSRSYRAVLTTLPLSPRSENAKEYESSPPNGFETDSDKSQESNDGKFSELEPAAAGENPHKENVQESFGSESTDEKQEIVKSSGLDEVVKLKIDNQFADDLGLEAEPPLNEFRKDTNDGLKEVHDSQQPLVDWPMEFEKRRMEIIELWDACSIPLVHRTYFFLVFKGDPSDSIYMEVELRRLSFLKLSQGTKSVKSVKAINREREMLTKLMLKKLSSKEREALYQKWGIGLQTKQRRLQLSRRLWTDTKDMDHIKESAATIAKLVGFTEPSKVPKEIVGLSFSTPSLNARSFSWKNNMPSLV